MIRTVFTMAVAGLIFAAGSGTSKAAPIAPLTAAITADGNVMRVASVKRCWRDRAGHAHCRYVVRRERPGRSGSR
jgi:hypothetical protein